MKQNKEGDDMNRNTTILIALLVIAITSLAAAIPADELRNAPHISPAASTRTATAGLPDDLSPGFTFSKNFYDVYGTPRKVRSWR
jgi:hypothetical protein